MGKLEVDKELIRELAALLDETGLTEIEVASDQQRLRVARQPGPVAAPAAAAASVAVAREPALVPEAAENYSAHPGAVSSPMVGTAYRAADPGAAPFVKAGDSVHQGQTVLIIEAMKTFNEIPAPRDGTVTRVFVENGTPVEYGDVLMLIE